jgi:hypothetical protein
MIITTDSHNCDEGSANNNNYNNYNNSYNNKHQHITNPTDLKVGLEILKSLTTYLLEYKQYQFLHHKSSRQTSIPTTASATTDSQRISVLSGGDVHVLIFVCPHHLSYAEEMGMMMMIVIDDDDDNDEIDDRLDDDDENDDEDDDENCGYDDE